MNDDEESTDSDAGPHCDYCEACGQSVCCDGHDEDCPTQREEAAQ